MTPKTHGPLFPAIGMIGTAAMQFQADIFPAPVREQAAKVKRWSEECLNVLVPVMTDASIRKMEKNGHVFVDACVKAGLIQKGSDERTPVQCARLMAGYYVANHLIYRLRLKERCWRYMDQTAGTLLVMLVEHCGMDKYEETISRVAEQMSEGI